MKLGVISDSHDNLTKLRAAVEILNEYQVDFVMHAGDFIAPFSLDALKKLKVDWVGVYGNNDGEKEGLFAKSEGKIFNPVYVKEIAGKKIALMHKYENISSKVDIIVYGHTHKPEIIKEDNLKINPGEVCGWVTGKSSLAVVDIEKMLGQIIYF